MQIIAFNIQDTLSKAGLHRVIVKSSYWCQWACTSFWVVCGSKDSFGGVPLVFPVGASSQACGTVGRAWTPAQLLVPTLTLSFGDLEQVT